jgi:hypothetical protein
MMSDILNVIVLVASLICGVLTIIFILNGLRRLYQGSKGGAQTLVFIALLSLITGALVLWQLVDVVNQLAAN